MRPPACCQSPVSCMVHSGSAVASPSSAACTPSIASASNNGSTRWSNGATHRSLVTTCGSGCRARLAGSKRWRMSIAPRAGAICRPWRIDSHCDALAQRALRAVMMVTQHCHESSKPSASGTDSLHVAPVLQRARQHAARRSRSSRFIDSNRDAASRSCACQCATPPPAPHGW